MAGQPGLARLERFMAEAFKGIRMTRRTVEALSYPFSLKASESATSPKIGHSVIRPARSSPGRVPFLLEVKR